MKSCTAAALALVESAGSIFVPCPSDLESALFLWCEEETIFLSQAAVCCQGPSPSFLLPTPLSARGKDYESSWLLRDGLMASLF